MAKAQDPYLQAAEGFLHATRDELDKLHPTVDEALEIARTYALMSIARSLNDLNLRQPDPSHSHVN
jgi:hypothetical protein